MQARPIPFRWPKLVHDISLLKEVVDKRPSKPETWDEIAKTLSGMFETL